MPTVLFFVVNSERIQNKLARRVTVMMSEMLGNHISTGNVRVSLFNRVTVNDLLVTCMYGDTVLSVAELTARLNMFAFSSREIDIRKVVLYRADIRLANDPETDEVNIKFITNRFKSDDAEKGRWNFGIRSIEFVDCLFSYKNPLKTFDKPFGMDYSDIYVSGLNMAISNFQNVKGGVRFRIRRLTGVEKCGLELHLISHDLLVDKNNLSFKNVNITTSLSYLEAKEVSFQFESFKDFSDGFFSTKVSKKVNISASDIAFDDLAYFVPYFGSYSGALTINGNISGTIDNLRGEKINIHFGEMTRINGDFDFRGLPNLRTTLIYANITDMVTCPKDIELVQIARLPGGHVTIPENMHQLNAIEFKGNFTGFFDDFVTFGKFTTDLGTISTDISIRPLKGVDIDTTFTFRGRLTAENFNLGKLLMQPVIGKMSMSGAVEGSASVRGKIDALLEGNIRSVELKDYEYRNIIVDGAINNRMYNGHLRIDEPNIKVDFSGKVDMTEKIPSFDFLANVERAKLYNLKLVENDTSSFTAFNINAEFSGTNIDNLSGELVLKNSMFRRNNREIEINDVLLFTKAIRDTNQFILRSDIFDAEIRGQYQFLKLPESFFSMVKNFAPAWAPVYANPDSLSQNNFRFDARFKDTQKLTDFFVNEFSVARGTLLEGVYNPAHRDVHFVLSVPYMMLGEMQWQGFYMNASVEDSTFVVESGSVKFNANKNLAFENPTILARARGDSMSFDIRWNNWDSILYRGTIYSKVFFEQRANHQQIPLIKISSLPGQITIANEVWELTHSGITIDSTSIKIYNIRALMNNQEILASGVISRNEQDVLEIAVKDFDLSVLNTSLQFNQLLFGGIANGTASLSNLYDIPVFVSDIGVDGFSLNNNKFGDTNLTATWNSYNRSVHTQAKSILDDLTTMRIDGNYFVLDKSLNFDVFLDKVPMAILQPYISGIFSDFEGALSGNINLNGTINAPVMNGNIEIYNGALTLDMTKTRYNFAGEARVENNFLLLRGIEMFDRYRNTCRITDGYISIDRFKDIAFDLQLNANNLEVLNTGENDNNQFYGLAYATGSIRIRGNPHDVYLDIVGKTERRTQFNIPLSSSDEMSKNSFITFVDHSKQTTQRRSGLSSRAISAINSPNEPAPEARYTINMNVEVTSDAVVSLIFDARIGDMIVSRGAGNLNMNITNTRFDMWGTYTVEEGSYLFTLKNVLNKFFTIDKGGIITWSGDPFGALLNLKAIYMARPSLFHLMNDENFNRSVPVECILHISNILTNPNIRFELEMPNASQEVRSFMSAATSSEEEMTRQFLSLLIFNSFFPDPNRTTTGATGSGLETMGLSTASEFLTTQLSFMLSQLSNIDFDFRFRPAGAETGGGQNYEFDIGKNWWAFHANYEVTPENAENVGEFSFEIKLPNRNRLRVKAFSRANAAYLSQNPYTQGVGLLFREDFNKITDLFKRKKEPAARREEEIDIVEADNKHVIINEEVENHVQKIASEEFF